MKIDFQSGGADDSFDREFLKEVRGSEENREYRVCYPKELYDRRYTGAIYGLYIEDTRYFNVTGCGPDPVNPQVVKIGEVFDGKDGGSGADMLEGRWDGGALSFTYRGSPVNMEKYALLKDIYSRNTGIIESEVMLKKRAVIIGCGSGGSFIALELARSGVGRFLLIDNDIFGYHNIARHQCGVYDVGKRKTKALRERILAINPSAEVDTFEDTLQRIYPGDLERYFDADTTLLSCGDNRASAHCANRLAAQYHLAMIAAGAGHRAATGELFYYLPDKNMPCYSCVCGEDLSRDYSNESQRVWYADEIDQAKNDFQPGIAADIDYISIVVVKLAIDIMMRNEPGYQPKILPYLKQMTFLCNYMGDEEKNSILRLFHKPLQTVTCDTKFRDGCYLCRLIDEMRKKDA